MHDLYLIGRAIGGGLAPGVELLLIAGEIGRIAPIGQHLHDPHQAHLLGLLPGATLAGPVEQAAGEGDLAAAVCILHHVGGGVSQQRAIPVGLAHGDAVGSDRRRIDHPILVRAVDDVADGRADAAIIPADDYRVLAVGEVGQLPSRHALHRAIGDVLQTERRARRIPARAGVESGGVALSVVEAVRRLDLIPLLRQVQRGGDIPPRRHVNLRGGQFEGHALARDLDLQHRQQAHVARLVGEGGVFDVLHLSLRILGPIEDVEGVGQVIGVGGAVLEIDQHGPLAPDAQAIHLQSEGMLCVEGGCVLPVGADAVAVEAHLR